MPIKYIFTADDFGPIDFINRGINILVKQGIINSVQVFGNTDRVKLKKELATLYNHIPEGNSLDIGIHLTLSSGKPLFKKQNKSIKETWGKMVSKKNGEYYFKKYSRFYFPIIDDNNSDYIDTIAIELKTQVETLGEIINEVNTENDSQKLIYNSASCHHNLYLTSEKLFSVFLNSLNYKDRILKVRSPRTIPHRKDESYFNFVLPLFNFSDRKEHRKAMTDLTDALAKGKYPTVSGKSILTPHTTDILFYKSLGSLMVGKISKSKIESRKRKFHEMINRQHDTFNNPIVEFIFHVGFGTEKINKEITQGYLGVNHKYFDNRMIEYHSLIDLKLSNKLNGTFKSITSWEKCDNIRFEGIA